MKLKQGTISVLFGCHSPFHSLLVLISWLKLYRRWPRFWQLVCIFLHDIGHWGKDYLDDNEEKIDHWILGAQIGSRLFGLKAYWFLAGHCSNSGYLTSDLYKPDKYSWYIAPEWWLFLNNLVEPKLAMGYGNREAIRLFKAQVKASIESGEYRPTHEMFLGRCQGKAE